jgi:hypothetical protein
MQQTDAWGRARPQPCPYALAFQRSTATPVTHAPSRAHVAAHEVKRLAVLEKLRAAPHHKARRLCRRHVLPKVRQRAVACCCRGCGGRARGVDDDAVQDLLEARQGTWCVRVEAAACVGVFTT